MPLFSHSAPLRLSRIPLKTVTFSNTLFQEPDASNSALKVSTYDTTPIMSTYLLAFVIGEFDFVEGTDKNGVLVRVYTPVGKITNNKLEVSEVFKNDVRSCVRSETKENTNETNQITKHYIRISSPFYFLGKKEQGEFALDVAVKTLPFYNDYFEIPYPLPKMDLIAIPDFSAGIKEHHGCHGNYFISR